ncbi:DUF167 domain-containing protein [Candidatus Sumerlaeota bacterium]|nr:DUF167 domain-containing protein [Candidatus Sumerlaeales bacterium]NLD60998.1 DUF167 domain-containing protein [Candidatus Sumerlaeota bacterium]
MIEVKVHPKAKRNAIVRHSDELFEIWTTAAPDKGDANDAVTRMLAKELNIARSNLSLVRGHTARTKFFSISE